MPRENSSGLFYMLKNILFQMFIISCTEVYKPSTWCSVNLRFDTLDIKFIKETNEADCIAD